MAKEIGNSELLEVWASEGETSTPFVSKQRQGWLFQEQPPSALMNWVHNEQQQKINHLLKHGVSEWSANTAYERGAIVKHANTAWHALRNNTNSEPAVDNEDWAEVSTLPIIRAPDLISPIDGEVDVVAAAELTASEYAPVYSVDDRDYREFEVDTAGGDFSDPIRTTQVDADSWVVDPALDTDKGYVWRCRDVSVRGDVSAWSDVEGFTTGNIFIDQPAITAPEDNATDIPETPTLESSAFSVTGGSDTHVASYWRVFQGSTEVWASGRTTGNLTSIGIPSGVLEDGQTVYTAQVRHEGDDLGVSSWSDASSFTTQESFVQIETPSITAPLEGETDVDETPTFESSAFSVINGSDTHVASFWEVYDSSDSLVWSSGRTMTNRTSITIPAGELEDGETTYKVRVRHEGQSLGNSAWSDTVSFVTQDSFDKVFAGLANSDTKRIGASSLTADGTYSGPATVNAAAFGGGFLFISDGSTVRKIDPATMTQLASYTGHANNVESLEYGQDGNLYSGDGGGVLHKIEPSTMSSSGSFTESPRAVSLAWGDDGFVYVGEIDAILRKIDPATMTQSDIFDGADTYRINAVAYGTDGFVYAGTNGSGVIKIDPSIMAKSADYTSEPTIRSLAFGTDGNLYSGTNDNVKKIDPSTMTGVGAFGNSSTGDALAFGADGFLYSGGTDNAVRKIDPADMTEADSVTLASDVRALAFNISIPDLLGFTS